MPAASDDLTFGHIGCTILLGKEDTSRIDRPRCEAGKCEHRSTAFGTPLVGVLFGVFVGEKIEGND